MKKEHTVVLFIGYGIGLDSTFASDYVKPVELLNASGIHTDLLVLSPLGELLRKNLRKTWAQRFRSFPVSVHKHIIRVPMAPSRLVAFADESWLLALTLRRLYSPHQALILHAVGSKAGYLAVRVRHLLPNRNLSVVFRSSGPSADEYLYRIGGPEHLDHKGVRAFYHQLQTQEDLAYRNADVVVALSEPMRQYATMIRGGPDKVTNIGCKADVSMFSRDVPMRDQRRRELGWDNDLVIIHSGTLHPWQRPIEIVQLFKQILDLEPRSRLVMLTRDSKIIEAALFHSDIPSHRCTVRSAHFAEMPSYLAAADIGLIGRGLMEEPSSINAFSSPIKFAEYLAAGCPVLMGDGIGDYSQLVNVHDLGLVLPHQLNRPSLRDLLQEFLKRYAQEQSEWRTRCLLYARGNLDVHKSIESYRAIYCELNAKVSH